MNIPLIMVLAQKPVAIPLAEELICQGYRTWVCTSITQALIDVVAVRPTVLFIEDHFIEHRRDVLEIYFYLRDKLHNPLPFVLVSSHYVPEGKVAQLDVVAFDIMQQYNALEYIYRTFPTSRVAMWYPSNPATRAIADQLPLTLIVANPTAATIYANNFLAHGYSTLICTSLNQAPVDVVVARPSLLLLEDDQLEGNGTALDVYFFLRHRLQDSAPVVLLSTRHTAEHVRCLDLVRFDLTQRNQAIDYIYHLLSNWNS